MKKLKKRLVFLACLVFLTALFTIAASSASISSSHWAIDYVDFVTNMGIVAGTRGTYSPEESLTRAQAAQAMAKTKNVSFSSTTPPTEFSDVNSSTKYAGAIKWAVDNGLVNGFPEGTFRPTAGILRKDFCVLLKRYCDKFGVSLTATTSYPSFTDSGDIPSYASSAITTLYRAGVISGYDDGSFRPNVEVRRSEAAAAFTRIHGLQYNKASSINVYIKSDKGVPLQGAATYIYSGNSGSGDMYPYTPATSTRFGIAQTIQIPNTGLHGINVYHDDYRAVSIPNKVSPSKFYVFATMPDRKISVMQTPVSGFLAIDYWGHSGCNQSFDRLCTNTYYNAREPQNFGWRYGVTSQLEFHQAIDISYPRGTEVRCVFKNAKVLTAEYKQGCGNTVQLENTTIAADGGDIYYIATYMHLETIAVSKTQNINNYTKIGTVGNTGTSAYHLHFSVAKDSLLSASSNNPSQISQFIDPLSLMPS